MTCPRRTGLRRLLPLALLAASLLASAVVSSATQPAAATPAALNPLANIRWGNYSGPADELYSAYRSATGEDKTLLGKLAAEPRMRWFGAWQPNDQISQIVHDYIANVTGGQPNVLVQMAVFRLPNLESQACTTPFTLAQQASYRQWIDSFAAAVGSTHVAMVLQPDLAVWQCYHGPVNMAYSLVRYAAQKFSSLPHTSVYIDAGSPDWRTIAQSVVTLKAAGISYVRGFALNATHYTSTGTNIDYGILLGRALYAAGVPDMHYVINTANNGRPFTYQNFRGADFDNAGICTSRTEWDCVAVGILPTTQVENYRLPEYRKIEAGNWVDAYLWYGRSWLYRQAAPFSMPRALQLATTIGWF